MGVGVCLGLGWGVGDAPAGLDGLGRAKPDGVGSGLRQAASNVAPATPIPDRNARRVRRGSLMQSLTPERSFALHCGASPG